ncbi:glucagon-1-like [Protopterus annectens]|uniref:glucagon-1-like n=1 Tax=Protopterus annectens TaxID=7888 RepID=UPI001CFBD4AC|nr:glucagon-1-like [Protopterus annectens]
MNSLQWIPVMGGLILILTSCSSQFLLKDTSTESSRWREYKLEHSHMFASNNKRHSEGTFSSDFTRHLDKMKAKDFVHWLINTKRYSSAKRDINQNSSGFSYPSGFSLFRFEVQPLNKKH